MSGKYLLLVMTVLLMGHSAFSKEEELMQLLPKKQHAGVDFLLSNMPKGDVAALSEKLLAENIEYAYRARSTFPWAATISDDLFLNYVLPYANLDESRDPWRKQFFEKFGDTVAGCKSAGEAAIKLNTTIYEELNVHYSKQRPKANQSPAESIKAGRASCTGLSILLVNACRAVGVPARVVGTPRWLKGGGNHTWVEVWDDGWHPIGAAESKRLGQIWFGNKAAEQVGHGAKHAIYAASFKKTDLHFPLAWAPSVKYVSALDVTAHYAAKKQAVASKEEVKKALEEKPLVGLIADLKKQDVLISRKDYAGIKELIWQKYVDEIKADGKRRDEHAREPLPKKVIWDCKMRCERGGSKDGFWPTAEKENLHYWLGLDRYDKSVELVAERIVVELDSGKNLLDVKEIGNYVRFYLNSDLVDLGREITIRVKGQSMRVRPKLSLGVMVRSMLDRGDPNYIFPVCLTLSKNPEGTWMLE